MNGKTVATIISWPISMPILNENKDAKNLSGGICISFSKPAKPSPWNSPNENISSNLAHGEAKKDFLLKKTVVMATAAIEKAITGSTNFGLIVNIPVPAKTKVMLWAMVNVPVYSKTSFRLTNTSIKDKTKRMWSGPDKICPIPNLMKSRTLSKKFVFR